MIWTGTFGMVDIIFVLALMGFAIWKTSWIRIVLSLCLLVWGAFAAPYDIKYAAPLVAIGSILLFSGIFHVIQGQRRST